MSTELPPPSPLLSRLLASERARAFPEDRLDALRQRIAEPAVAAPAAAAPGLASSSLSQLIAASVISAVVGAGGGYALRAATAPVETVRVEVPVPVPVAVPAPALPETPAPPSPEKARPPRAAPAPAHVTDAALARERSLIDTARSALLRRDAKAALAALQTHRAEFNRGGLAEEREALQIRALLLAGRAPEAHEAFRRFREKWPTSVFTQALESLPGIGTVTDPGSVRQ